MNTNKFEGSASGGGYQDAGVGNNESTFREVTRKGKYPADNSGPNRSQGETAGAGSLYAAVLNERPNVSNPRNRGPERSPSRSLADAIPMVNMGQRQTGRIGG